MDHKVVSHDEWLAARQELLAKEKAFQHQCDEMSRMQRDLPWERVTKECSTQTTRPAARIARCVRTASPASAFT
jgi:predicted dithiol-disulfide oxidoreductase (DUF899 family)